MMSRIMCCYLPDREIFEVDLNAGEKNESYLNSLSCELRDILNSFPHGHIKATKEGAEWFKNWYIENEMKLVEDERLKPHRARAPATAVRLAILLAASCGEEILTKELLEQAIAINDWFIPTMWAMYGYTDEMSSGVGKLEKLVINKLKGQLEGTMLHHELLGQLRSRFKSKGQFVEVMENLVEMQIVEKLYKGGIEKDWPPLGWTLKGKAE
jgi:hypothetical protein